MYLYKYIRGNIPFLVIK